MTADYVKCGKTVNFDRFITTMIERGECEPECMGCYKERVKSEKELAPK